MDLVTYSGIIEKTAVYPKQVDNFDIAYCYLGIMDESFEFNEAYELGNIKAMKKEAGDVLWYLTALANFFKIDIRKVFVKKEMSIDGEYKIHSKFPGLVKKYYRDEKEIPIEIVEVFINANFNSVVEGFNDDEILEILQMNYDKLIKRRETNTLHGDGDNREEI